ncbi:MULTISPECIES: CoA ester lyase [Mesorhizobium]|uniref:HpcH/HpaI aldolase/citrate lyase family protein n=1 Tax=Mesorhizobium TaxID=68287 RepID=UPI0007ED527C|nr:MULTISPECIES: CoA ester lyase [Mesorhizobium]QIA25252.1 CoA ester lyase [Mesorhizobium sp. AA22]
MSNFGYATLWRSLLFVPVHEERFLEKAHARGADAVILDLEDSVPAFAKDTARGKLRTSIERISRHGLSVVVRVNRDLANCVVDLGVAVSCGVDAVMLPKVRGPDNVALIDEFISERERHIGLAPQSIGLLNLIETPAALSGASQIAAASDRTIGLGLGTEDFSAECGFEPTYENLFGPCQQLILACRVQGVQAFGLPGSIAQYDSSAGFGDLAVRSRKMGFDGVLCVHPNQIAAVNSAFRPTLTGLERASRIIAAFEEAEAHGRGVVSIDGAMIDLPIVKRARALLASSQKTAA